MCFGKKDHYDPGAVAAKPSNQPPSQPTYASTPSDSKTAHPPPSQPQYGQSSGSQHDYAPPPGPPPGLSQPPPAAFASELSADNTPPPPGPPPSHRPPQDEYAPPTGPPPSHAQKQDDFAPPPGPPPSHAQGDYAPPPGPPPSKQQQQQPYYDYTAPPPGPPPAAASKPQHDWETVVPDTSLFPPPPDIFSGHDRSWANNATEAQAEAGSAWCSTHPMGPPIELDPPALAALQQGNNLRLITPPMYRGVLNWVQPGVWAGKTDKSSPDSTILAYPPLYSVRVHSPLASGRARTVYYEVKIKPDSRSRETSLALGYTALPYPSFRLPGWHRGSLAVHGDDGHKYINDMWGGRTFAAPFKRGDTLGLGMTFTPSNGQINVEVFLTRNGNQDGRWDLHEETDAQNELPVTGLEGFHDLSIAIGTFDEVSFEVVLDPAKWMYRGVPQREGGWD